MACDKGIGEKNQKQTSFQIWISPALSNCFGVPIIVYCSYVSDKILSQASANISPVNKFISKADLGEFYLFSTSCVLYAAAWKKTIVF